MTRQEIISKAIANRGIPNYIFYDDESKLMELGKGGSGYLLIAKQRLGSNVTIKRAVKFFIYKEDLWADYGVIAKKNFDNEITNISNLSHQNIIKLIDGNEISCDIDGTHYDIPYIVTEFIDGFDAEKIFDKGNEQKAKDVFKTEEFIFNFITQILDGLEYLHKNSFFHCDIAPKNIYINQNVNNNYFVIIGDFDAAIHFCGGNDETIELEVRGTRKYMPEEVKVYKHKHVLKSMFRKFQPWWDVYSTLITIKEILESIQILEKKKFNSMRNILILYDKIKQCINKKNIISIIEIRSIVRDLHP